MVLAALEAVADEETTLLVASQNGCVSASGVGRSKRTSAFTAPCRKGGDGLSRDLRFAVLVDQLAGEHDLRGVGPLLGDDHAW